MKRNFILLYTLFFAWWGSVAQADESKTVDALLSQFHQAAADAEWDTYFGLLTDNAIFLGTDATERWDKPTFESYARPTNGWTYTKTSRQIIVSNDGNTAWFDELLWNASYGECRGSGVAVKEDNRWQLAHYHLTMPIPNALIKQFSDAIQQSNK